MLLETATNDWVGSKPVFYNVKSGTISESFFDVVDLDHVEIDIEGLNNYFRFGYSVFGHTPIKDVCFLQANETIEKGIDGKLIVSVKEDPVLDKIHRHTSEKDLWEQIEDKILQGTKEQNVILPLSGGYDSRIIALCANRAKSVSAYTYGISSNPSESYEAVIAKSVSGKMGIQWKLLDLSGCNQYMKNVIDIYGPTMNTATSYHYDMYSQIQARYQKEGLVASGLIGDAWAGTVHVDCVSSPDELDKLGYTHGICIPSSEYVLEDKREYRDAYYEKNRQFLSDHRWNTVLCMRNKMIFLRYLIDVPSKIGFDTFAPYIDIDIAINMLNLPDDRRKNRVWQQDYLKRRGALYKFTKSDYNNIFDLRTMEKNPLVPLNEDLLSQVVNRRIVSFINNNINKKPYSYKINRNLVLSAWNHLGYKGIMNRRYSQAYNMYTVLLPIQRLLEKMQ